jgi:hypothetical protein
MHLVWLGSSGKSACEQSLTLATQSGPIPSASTFSTPFSIRALRSSPVRQRLRFQASAFHLLALNRTSS